MNEEEMKRLWQEQGTSVRFTPGLVQEIEQEGGKLKKAIKTRDRLEELGALLAGAFFLRMFFTHDNLFVKTGCILIILFAIEVVVVLRLNRKQAPTEGLPLKEQLQKELTFFRKQKLLLQKVVYWYIAPCFLGITFFAYGVSDYWWMFGIHCVFNIFIMMVIYRLNRNSVKEKFNPVIRDLEYFLNKLEK